MPPEFETCFSDKDSFSLATYETTPQFLIHGVFNTCLQMLDLKGFGDPPDALFKRGLVTLQMLYLKGFGELPGHADHVLKTEV